MDGSDPFIYEKHFQRLKQAAFRFRKSLKANTHSHTLESNFVEKPKICRVSGLCKEDNGHARVKCLETLQQ